MMGNENEAVYLGMAVGAAKGAGKAIGKLAGELKATQDALDEAMAYQIVKVAERDAYRALAAELLKEANSAGCAGLATNRAKQRELLVAAHRRAIRRLVEVTAKGNEQSINSHVVSIAQNEAGLSEARLEENLA